MKPKSPAPGQQLIDYADFDRACRAARHAESTRHLLKAVANTSETLSC